MPGHRSGRTWLIVLTVVWVVFLAALGVVLFVPGVSPIDPVGTTVDEDQVGEAAGAEDARDADGVEGEGEGDAAEGNGANGASSDQDEAQQDEPQAGRQGDAQQQNGQQEEGQEQDQDGAGGQDQVEGWYAEQQASDGADAYAGNCARCHGEDLEGAAGQPALTGDPFWNSWGGESVQALFDYTRENMPLTNPGSLDDQTYAAVVAHVLSANGLPAGGGPLEPGGDRMQNLVLERAAASQDQDGQQQVEQQGAQEEDSQGDAQQDGQQEEQDQGQQEQEPQGQEQPQDEQQAQDGSGSVAFTEEQVEAGAETYAQNCAQCHGSELQGTAANPALVGETFLGEWDTVWALFDYTRQNMPLTNPGSLSDTAYAEITAHVLAENGFSAGDQELTPDEQSLQDMPLASPGGDGQDGAQDEGQQDEPQEQAEENGP